VKEKCYITLLDIYRITTYNTICQLLLLRIAIIARRLHSMIAVPFILFTLFITVVTHSSIIIIIVLIILSVILIVLITIATISPFVFVIGEIDFKVSVGLMNVC
jgi:uncharacterized membrane protein YhaH (DUF805 family)